MSCALDAQVSPAFSTSCLGFKPASPVPYFCMQMAGTLKRLRRKTTVSQKGCSELMMFTAEWWMQFLLPVGKYMPEIYVAAWKRVWRLLSKAWREVWDQGFRVRMTLHEDHYSTLCLASPRDGGLKFYRDSSNRIKFHSQGFVREGRYCLVSMPWNTFIGLRPILSRMAKDLFRHPQRGKSFTLLAYVQTAFCLQSEL